MQLLDQRVRTPRFMLPVVQKVLWFYTHTNGLWVLISPMSLPEQQGYLFLNIIFDCLMFFTFIEYLYLFCENYLSSLLKRGPKLPSPLLLKPVSQNKNLANPSKNPLLLTLWNRNTAVAQLSKLLRHSKKWDQIILFRVRQHSVQIDQKKYI